MSYDAQGNVYIGSEAWLKFVAAFLPASDYEYLEIGIPSAEGDGSLIVPYAMSQLCPPREWTEPPSFIDGDQRLAAVITDLARAVGMDVNASDVDVLERALSFIDDVKSRQGGG